MKVVLVGVNSKYIHTDFGIRCVAGFAHKQGFQVDVLDENINTPILKVLDNLVAGNWDVYGFDVHIWSNHFVKQLIGLLRKVKPDSIIVLGGPEVSYGTADFFEADYIIKGEGEIAFSDLMKNGMKRNEKSVIIQGKPCELGELPFPYFDLENVVSQHKIIYYEASRGCPFRCSYCLSSVEHSVRQRPLQLILNDLDKFVDAGAPLVKFVDRTYNLDEKFYFPIFKYLAEKDCNTTFHFEVKADLLSNEVLDFLSDVPKRRFQFEVGIQSTNQDTLMAINRANDWPKLSENCKKILACGNIHLHTDLIAGLPYEGLKEWSQSFNDVFALRAPMLQLGFLKVLPGTQIESEKDKYGLIYMPEAPYEILQTKWLSYEELAYLRKFDKIFDVVYNGGFFPQYLEFLLGKFSDAFSFFDFLVRNWPKDDIGNYNAKTVAYCLYTIFGDKGKELLQKDIYEYIHNWRPDWLDWHPYSRRNLRKEQK